MRYSQLLQAMVVGLVFMVAAIGDFALAEVRTWTDATGKFKIEAELVEATDEHVVLQKTDGKTVKVPLAKLSDADKQFIADQQASSFGEEMPAEDAEGTENSESAETPAKTTEEPETTAEEASPPPDTASDIKAARKAVTDFLDMMRKEDRKPIATLLTKEARAKVADGTSPVLTLPKPDSKSTTKIGKATIDGNDATVAIKLRLGGVNQDGKVSLRREGKAWKVWSLSVTPTGSAGGTEAVANFETGESSVPATTAVAGGTAATGPKPTSFGSGRSVGLVQSAPEPEPEATEEPAVDPEMKEERETDAASGEETESVDESDPKALLKQIETFRAELQGNSDMQSRMRIFTSIVGTAEKLLNLENATKAQRTVAAQSQLEALQTLLSLQVPKLGAKIEALAAHVEEYNLKELKRPSEALTLFSEMTYSKTPAALTKAVSKVEEFLASGPLGIPEAQLAMTAVSLIERMQHRGMSSEDVAASIESLAAPLASSRDKKIAQAGEQLLGKSRRLGLVGKPMELHGVTWDGKPLDMSQFEGKVVLVDFWATWCGPCKAEMPNIRANYDKYHDKGFEVIAISIDSNLDALNQYVQSEQMPWTVVADRHARTPASKQLAAYYGVNAIPCTILIGRDGNVISLSARGPQLEKQLEKLLGSGG